MKKEIIRRGMTSFGISSFAGMMVNLIIDVIVNAAGVERFISISPDFSALFPTPVIAAYVNVMLYGVIGASFAMMTFVFELQRIGYWIQWAIYFVVTGVVCLVITMAVWQLHKNPKAFVITLGGYAVTYVIIGIVQYKSLKEDICLINEKLQ